MKQITLALLSTLLLWGAAQRAQAQAFDSVRKTSGTTTGKITKITPVQVTINKGGLDEEVPVNEINFVTFAGEPSDLAQARVHVTNGRYEDAKASLAKIDPAEATRPEIKQDIEFYAALAASKLALGGAGSVADAGKLMYNFENTHKGSYHYLEACEVLGDLFVALGRYPQAESYYDKLSKAAWPDYKARSAVLVGRALQAQNKHAEAVARFDQALQIDSTSPEAARQKLAATLGKAVSIASAGQTAEAVKMVQTVIATADPEQAELHARAYNALGACYLKEGKSKDALLAYLHVDVLYNSSPEAHAEALSHLSKLWDKAGSADRGRAAAALLKERYPGSRWAQ